MTGNMLIQTILSELPANTPVDLTRAIEVTVYNELAGTRKKWNPQPLRAPYTLRFESTEFVRSMGIQSNYYAALCLNFEWANRYSLNNGIQDIFGNLDADAEPFRCTQLYCAEEHFGYLESAFGTTTPEVPENHATEGELANQWAKRLTTQIAETYHALFRPTGAGNKWRAPNYASLNSLAKTGRLCAAHLIADLDQRTSIFVELQRPLSVSCG